MIKNKVILFGVLLLLFLGSIFIGNPDYWFEEKEAEGQEPSIYQKFNIAVEQYYKQKYDQALSSWNKIFSYGQTTQEILLKSIFNLGNVHFKITEKLENKKKWKRALTSINLSLEYFRDAIEQARYLPNKQIESKAVFNYELARKKKKILEDLQRLEKQKQDAQKGPYELLLELVQTEKEILDLLNQIDSNKRSNFFIKKKEQLQNKRIESLIKIKLLEKFL